MNDEQKLVRWSTTDRVHDDGTATPATFDVWDSEGDPLFQADLDRESWSLTNLWVTNTYGRGSTGLALLEKSAGTAQTSTPRNAMKRAPAALPSVAEVLAGRVESGLSCTQAARMAGLTELEAYRELDALVTAKLAWVDQRAGKVSKWFPAQASTIRIILDEHKDKVP